MYAITRCTTPSRLQSNMTKAKRYGSVQRINICVVFPLHTEIMIALYPNIVNLFVKKVDNKNIIINDGNTPQQYKDSPGYLYFQPSIPIDTGQNFLFSRSGKLCRDIPVLKQTLQPFFVKLLFQEITDLL